MSYLEERRKHIEDGRPLKPKKTYVIAKVSAKRAGKEKQQQKALIAEQQKAKSILPQYFAPSVEMANEVYGDKEKKVKEQPITPLWQWFLDKKVEMTGICAHCSGKTMLLDKESETKFHYSIAHIFSKSLFPSVATHEDNWIELCYYSPSCHKNYDDGYLDLINLNCFDLLVKKAAKIYPFIAKEERKRIPPILLQYIETEI